ncbi:HipA domain-containing protein [Burkholderia sp. MSMB0856]|uniref:HipA domain-containing protein n=1 Tax=Burkholderia sp. MSMB0856 TaxID=1637869 RepID=UPI000A72547D|nr:HipA domain-containing protein [Burkholderia sp. MSMB0856]
MVESIEPRRQRAIIDVVHWETDAEFGVFPQGARAKEAVFAPTEPSDPCLIPSRRYLFKRSKRSYPDQFWGEVIAYRIGCQMGVLVPPALAASNSGTGHSAALIEWFYDDNERFVHAGDFLQARNPDFDREQGRQHNFVDAVALIRALAIPRFLQGDWRQWLADMALFDAVIGNTDRHQDNWGFVFTNPEADRLICTLAPLFDNGTSLGHERFVERIAGWRDSDYERYISRGTHHMGKTLADGFSSAKHAELVAYILEQWPTARAILAQRLNLLDGAVEGILDELMELDGDLPLSPARARFVGRLLTRRISLLQEIVR